MDLQSFQNITLRQEIVLHSVSLVGSDLRDAFGWTAADKTLISGRRLRIEISEDQSEEQIFHFFVCITRFWKQWPLRLSNRQRKLSR